MNRKVRRAALKGENRKAGASQEVVSVDFLVSAAEGAYRDNQLSHARDICRQVLARDPSHTVANNLLGIIYQALGRDRVAIQHFAKAIALDENNAFFHYNIAFSYQRLGDWDQAIAHSTRSLALRLDGRPVAEFITNFPIIAACLNRIAQQWPRRLTMDALFGDEGIGAAAEDAFLRCALEKTEMSSPELENFLSSVRFALLQLTVKTSPEFTGVEDKLLCLYAAFAQQCFINEYVLDYTEDEGRQAESLRDELVVRLTNNSAIPPLLLITVAAYFPLYRLPQAASLQSRSWPSSVEGLIRQQISEPFEEAQLRTAIPSLTTVDDEVSGKVQRQYEENPYPRWTMAPDVSIIDDWRTRFAARQLNAGAERPLEILVAGCGTGQNPIQAALKFPAARVLAVDLSHASLAYALRKTREAGIRNIEYAQADLLKLGSIGQTFDRIEAVGVLHHLADPREGWRVLLTLLRPGGVMDIGLYSETARQSIVTARAFIAERGYGSTTEDIRRFRREMKSSRDTFARDLITASDFYTTSGCRDLLFHVMEHRFNIPDIAEFLAENGLSFLGFRLGDQIVYQFRSQFPSASALTDLNCWHAFEQENPQTFSAMYRFAVRKKM